MNGLTNGQTYVAYVYTYSSLGYGGWALSNTFVPAVPPTTPANIVATAAPSGGATVRWSPSITGGGATLTGYILWAYDWTWRSYLIKDCGTTCTFTGFGPQNSTPSTALITGYPTFFYVWGYKSSGQLSPVAGSSNYIIPGPADGSVGAGSRSQFSYDNYQLTDRMSARVNIGTGNLMVNATDLVLPMVGGGSLPLGRVLNSFNVSTGAASWFSTMFGYDWHFNSAPDMRLVPRLDGVVELISSTGNASMFTPSGGGGYTHPDGINANLTTDGAGNYKLVELASQQTMNFNSAGDLTSLVDRNGNTVNFTYPDGRRITSITSTAGSGPGNTVTISYNGPAGRVDKISQAATADTPAREVSYAYDPGGMGLSTSTDTEGGITGYLWDANANVVQITDPENQVTQFEYDSLRRVTKVTQKIPSAADAVTIYDYSTPGRTRVTDPNNNPVVDYSVSTDGRVTQVKDAFGRLAETGWAPANHKVVSGRNGKTVSGTPVWDPNSTVGWNADNERMTGLTDPMGSGGTLGYNDAAYGPTDPRHWLPSTSTDSMSYAGMGQAERTISPAGTAQNGAMGVQTETLGGQTSSYITDGAGSLVYQTTPSGDFYYFFDGLGSVIGLIDATTGDQRATYSYDPFGSNATAAGVNGALPANPWRWMGGYLDGTGLYHFGERYYDPATGRFLQVDPIAGGSANGYVYANGDPVNFSDLSGLKPSNKEKQGLRKGINSLRDRIREHQDKIDEEMVKPLTDWGLVNHWQGEIGKFEGNIAKKERRLRAIHTAAAIATMGPVLWWARKGLSPLCGPAAPVCAVAL